MLHSFRVRTRAHIRNFDGIDTFTAFGVQLNVGAYLGFIEGSEERGFGTRELFVNDTYHTIEGEYTTSYGTIPFYDYRYSGETLNGTKSGLGRMELYKKDSSHKDVFGKYEGYFKNNTFHGDGRYIMNTQYTKTQQNQFEFVGTFRDQDYWTGVSFIVENSITRTCKNIFEEKTKLKCND